MMQKQNMRTILGRIRRELWNFFYRFMTTQQIFSTVYRNKFWGNDKNVPFSSGQGSTDENIVKEYISSIEKFVREGNTNLSALDIGCGDFNVGEKIFALFKHYTALDIAPKLILHNTRKFKSRNLQFRICDATKESLPHADVLFLRQVLQHLSNEKISKLLENLPSTYKYLIVTEHLPFGQFIPNLNIRTGHETRIRKNSGVVLHSEPFHFTSWRREEICKVFLENGTITTTVYFNSISNGLH